MSEIGNRHMHFNLDDPHQKTCFDFLKLLKKSSSQFVSDLVCAYLKMQNITDIASLSSKEAKDIAEGVTYKFMSPEQYMSQTNNLALQTMMALVNSGFAQQPANLQTVVPVLRAFLPQIILSHILLLPWIQNQIFLKSMILLTVQIKMCLNLLPILMIMS